MSIIDKECKNKIGCKMVVVCDSCDEELCTSEEDDGQYEGVNLGKHECSGCKRVRQSNYDSYVDPLGFYR